MCGIAGIVGYALGSGRVDSRELSQISERMVTRGPDGQGSWFSAGGDVGFAHRRLAIIDLSDSGLQPMRSRDGRYVIVFNGEIYNYRALRAELEAAGTVFASGSDTEVLLHLFAAQGAGMLPRLRGMYAFAIWDTVEQSLFLARDPFGIKPLYYADDGQCIRFASQVKALLRGAVARTPDIAGHVGYFIWGSVPEPWTLYQSIRSLPAGYFATVHKGGRLGLKQFADVAALWRNANASPAPTDRGTAIEMVAQALRDTVAAHHVADVPVGVFLSAGLDSTMIASLSAAIDPSLHTVTLGFEEYRGTPADEVPQARHLARQVGATHASVFTTAADFEADAERLLDAMDQPSIDGVNTWFVSKAARGAGLKVALSGLGGDELFASYPSFSEIPRIVSMMRRLSLLRRHGAYIRRLLAPLLGRITSPKYASLPEYGGTYGAAYLLRRALHLPWEQLGSLSRAEIDRGWAELQTLQRLDATVGHTAAAPGSVSALEMSWYMRNQLLRDADWASMAHSLEVRTPLVDWPLVSTIAPLLAAHPKLSKSELFQRAAPNLMTELLRRPKTGFSIPVRQWLAGGNRYADFSHGRGLRGWAAYVLARQGAGRGDP